VTKYPQAAFLKERNIDAITFQFPNVPFPTGLLRVEIFLVDKFGSIFTMKSMKLMARLKFWLIHSRELHQLNWYVHRLSIEIQQHTVL
jgi:hypothetical protein